MLQGNSKFSYDLLGGPFPELPTHAPDRSDFFLNERTALLRVLGAKLCAVGEAMALGLSKPSLQFWLCHWKSSGCGLGFISETR